MLEDGKNGRAGSVSMSRLVECSQASARYRWPPGAETRARDVLRATVSGKWWAVRPSHVPCLKRGLLVKQCSRPCFRRLLCRLLAP